MTKEKSEKVEAELDAEFEAAEDKEEYLLNLIDEAYAE